MEPLISLVVPTRERAQYLVHSLRTCLASPEPRLEVLVMDNASSAATREVVQRINDSRLRYLRSDARLSMRDNFERGLAAAGGEIVCFIGDDDGVLPGAVEHAIDIFERLGVDALSAARAHYFWPDLQARRKNTSLLPRRRGVAVLDSRRELRDLLRHDDYYRLPCIYHGFVRRSVAERIRTRQGGRFFMSNNADVYSAIALSMEGVRFAFSAYPLVINGGSGRSNGAAQFAAGGQASEKELWAREDDLGFLPGFGGSMLMASFIIESALRYVHANGGVSLSDVFGEEAAVAVLERERELRLAAGRREQEADLPFVTAGLQRRPGAGQRNATRSRARRLVRSFLDTLPVDMSQHGVSNVADAAVVLGALQQRRQTGLLHRPGRQISAALRLARS